MHIQSILSALLGLIIVIACNLGNTLLADNKRLNIGLTELVFQDQNKTFESKPRMLEVAVWYPTEQIHKKQKIEFGIWKIKDAAKNAPILPGQKLPLIIFSHGYSGNQWVNTWFSHYLAEHRYIVAVVRHYGNSYRNMIPELCARPWHRPADVSFVLDQLLTHSHFKDHIDSNRIGAAGFSQGGMTCLWIAGAQAELTQEIVRKQITIVNHPECRMLHFKEIPLDRLNAVLDNFTHHDFEQANRSYCDERIKAVFAIAPGIDENNIMFKQTGLSKIDVPTYITIGEADYGLLEQAHFFAQHIPRCTFTLIPGQVTHMTLLNEGTEAGKISKPTYTLDHPSIDRGKIHAKVAEQALDFFNTHLF